MAYIINTFNTAQLTVVEDGTVDQTTDIKLVGKNYAGYGEIQNENFVFLLENFAGSTEPPKAITGQVWFDAADSKLRYYDGAKWRPAGGAEVADLPPSGNVDGDFWWDSANDQLYCWNGTEYVLIGPQSAGTNVTRFQSRTIRDTNNVTRPVIVSVIDDEVIHIISSTTFFIATDELPNYPGFDAVHEGLTLKDTQHAEEGQTSTDFRWWGTATNSDRLGGHEADDFILKSGASFTDAIQFGDAGYTLGDSADLRVKIINDNQVVIANEVGLQIFFQVRDIAGNLQMPIRLVDNALLPGYMGNVPTGANNFDFSTVGSKATDLGSLTAPFNNVYGSAFKGVSDSALALSLPTASGTIQALANTNAVPNSIAGRDASGDLKANVFFGTATSARFADLAEMYVSDKDYEPGTVLIVGGIKEVTECTEFNDDRVVGVVSSNPAYLMNNECDGVPVALRGRVPCKVIGPVHKGWKLVTSDTPGVAVGWNPNVKHGSFSDINVKKVIGISLETNLDENIKIVEIVV